MNERGIHKTAGERETILLVEDEEVLLELLKYLLEEKGYSTFTATDGEEAIEVYRRHKDEITLVLSDLGLPKLRGWQVFEQLKEINPDVKMIFASAYSDPEIKTEMLSSGAIDYIQKPYDPDKLIRKIHDVINFTEASKKK